LSPVVRAGIAARGDRAMCRAFLGLFRSDFLTLFCTETFLLACLRNRHLEGPRRLSDLEHFLTHDCGSFRPDGRQTPIAASVASIDATVPSELTDPGVQVHPVHFATSVAQEE
jgi:hypothetical protein